MALFSPFVIGAVYVAARRSFREPVRHTNYGVDGGPFSKSTIEAFVLRMVMGTLTSVALVAIVWQYYWPATLVILYGYFLVVVFSMKVVYRRLGLGIGRKRARIRFPKAVRSTRRWAASNGHGRR